MPDPTGSSDYDPRTGKHSQPANPAYTIHNETGKIVPKGNENKPVEPEGNVADVRSIPEPTQR